ncbi:MAG: hypothetical protein WDM78_16305 [Puia sp.]
MKDAYIPAMHRLGIKQIGVFKPVANDTTEIKKVIVLVQYISLDVWQSTKSNILKRRCVHNGRETFPGFGYGPPALFQG